jgi:hypothetical protein
MRSGHVTLMANVVGKSAKRGGREGSSPVGRSDRHGDGKARKGPQHGGELSGWRLAHIHAVLL